MLGRLLWLAMAMSPILFLVVAWRIIDTAPPEPLDVSQPAVLVPALLAVLLFLVATRWLEGWMGTPAHGSPDRHRFTLLVARLAVFEAISVLGLVAAILSQSLVVYLPYLVLSLAGMLLYRPQG